MDFDIEKIFKDSADSLKNEFGSEWEDLKSATDSFLQRRKARLELLIDLRLNEDISQEKYESRLNDEKDTAISELESIGQISKEMARKAVKNAFDSLEESMLKVLD